MIKFSLKSEFFKNVVTLITGTTIAQLIPIAISPLLTRLYAPDDFAVWGLYMSIVMIIISGVSTGNYEFAIVLPEEDRKALKLTELSIIAASAVSFILLLISILFNTQTGILLKNTNICQWLYLIPFSVLTLSILNSFLYWLNRCKSYKAMASNKIIKNTGISVANLGFGVSGFTKYGLISGQILGDFIAAFSLWRKINKNHKLFSEIKWKEYKLLGKEYKEFPLLSMPTNLCNNLSSYIPILLISIWFSSTLTGFYYFSLKILSIPMAFIGNAVTQTFYQKFTEIISDKTHNPKIFLVKIWFTLFAIGVIPLTIIFFRGGDIFSFVFGSQWKDAGEIAAILSPMILITFISSPTSNSFIILRKQNFSLLFGILLLILRPLAFYIGFKCGSFNVGLKFLVIFEIVETVLYNLVIWKNL
ncbi:MAG: lipopolysaccharide biosynthesis protein [Bacteroidota bacterium]|nr:lipopolysaccharide biosynthesis protein [Bacteroidota bacterium]